MNNIKIYKNKLRNIKDNYQPPVPQYQELNIEPMEYKSGIVPPNTPMIKSQDVANRNRQFSIREDNVSQVVLPNINKVPQQTWSSLDGEIIDDVFDQSHKMIDNNFYIEEVDPTKEDNDQSFISIVNDLKNDHYLLFLYGEAICSGPVEEIETEARALIFGEHVLCNGEPISEENIVVLKKIQIKVGVFLQ